jgi:hypothetical protein
MVTTALAALAWALWCGVCVCWGGGVCGGVFCGVEGCARWSPPPWRHWRGHCWVEGMKGTDGRQQYGANCAEADVIHHSPLLESTPPPCLSPTCTRVRAPVPSYWCCSPPTLPSLPPLPP